MEGFLRLCCVVLCALSLDLPVVCHVYRQFELWEFYPTALTSRSVVHVALMKIPEANQPSTISRFQVDALLHSRQIQFFVVYVGLRHNSTKTSNIHTIREDISITNIRYFSCTLLVRLFSKRDSGEKKKFQTIPKKDSCHFDCSIMKAWKNPLSF